MVIKIFILFIMRMYCWSDSSDYTSSINNAIFEDSDIKFDNLLLKYEYPHLNPNNFKTNEKYLAFSQCGAAYASNVNAKVIDKSEVKLGFEAVDSLLLKKAKLEIIMLYFVFVKSYITETQIQLVTLRTGAYTGALPADIFKCLHKWMQTGLQKGNMHQYVW